MLLLLPYLLYANFNEGYAAFKNANYSRAHWYWKAAAEQGDVAAQFGIGVLYERGLAVIQDYQQAVLWYHKAAERGNAPAQLQLGAIYYQGRGGIAPRLTEAAYWINQSAQAGYAKAKYALGCLYYEGNGLSRDYRQALSWFRQAAKQKVTAAAALVNIGGMYAQGIGVAKNLGFAYAYFDLAAKMGDNQAMDYRIGIQRLLGSMQLLDAQILAESWAKEFPKS